MNYQQNEVAGKLNSGNELENLGWSVSLFGVVELRRDKCNQGPPNNA